MEVQSRFTKVFDERVNSLIADGYCKRVDTRLSNLWIVRLRHQMNGNEIVLKGWPSLGFFNQQTNGVLTHSEYV